MQPRVRVGDRWVPDAVEVEWSTARLHGPTQATFTAAAHPATRIGAPVVVYAGRPVWEGTVTEVGPTIAAVGAYDRARSYLSLDNTGAPTTDPALAASGAVGRGLGWTLAPGSAFDGGPLDVPEGTMLLPLLDAWAERTGKAWRVLPGGIVLTAPDPTTPAYQVNGLTGSLTPVDDNFVTHVVAEYLHGTGDIRTVTAGSNVLAERFTRRETRLDLVGQGILTSEAAQAEADAEWALNGPRFGWAEPILLHPGDLTTLGGHPAALVQPSPGDMLRIGGTWDDSGHALTGHLDVLIDTITHRPDGTTLLTPAGYAPRTLTAALIAAATR